MNDLHSSSWELLAPIVGEAQAFALLQKYGTLTALAQADETELLQIRGIGNATARAIKSAFGLAQRLAREVLAEPPLLDTPEKIADLLREDMRLETTETFVVVLVNTRRRLIKHVRIATGTLDTLLIHPREVFKHAISHNAAACALAHGHPSGDPSPSESDIRITHDLIKAGQLLKIDVLDHVILGTRTTERSKDYASLRELGYFNS